MSEFIPGLREQRLWTPMEEDVLCELIADGHGFPDAAQALGRTRESCIGKFDRIRAAMGWQAS